MEFLASRRMFLLSLYIHVAYVSPLDITDTPKLLLVSLDGFRWDYLSRGYYTPNFDMLMRTGVHTKYMKPCMPSETFPNHFSIATGLYPESHGVVGNRMYDPVFDESIDCLLDTTTSRPDYERKWFDYNGQIEPIWITNQKKDGHRSGSIFWPGIEAWHKEFLGPIIVSNSTNWKQIHYETRVDIMLNWFFDKDKPINFGILYCEEPDLEGHKVGPNKDIRSIIERLDRELIGYLIAQLKVFKLFNQVNIIFVSDHGMSDISNVTIFSLNNYIKDDSYSHVSPFHGYLLLNMWAHEKYMDSLVHNLSTISPFVHVYQKQEFPERFHLKNNRRLGNVLLLADEGYLLVHNRSTGRSKKTEGRGDHGYDNNIRDMQGLFIGHGPVFRKGYETETINSVDIYNLMCSILGVQPALNNGTWSNVDQFLLKTGETEGYNMATSTITFLLVIVCCSLVAGLYTIYAVRVRGHIRYHSDEPRHRQIRLDELDVSTTLLADSSEEEF